MVKKLSGSAAVADSPVAPEPSVATPVTETAVVAATDNTASNNSSVSASELESYLINFVVEQTGYPEDMVDLDADLEGDLGIDSIKKAQLLGELNEMFHFADMSSSETSSMSLDDFPTLRAIRDYMVKKLSGSAAVAKADNSSLSGIDNGAENSSASSINALSKKDLKEYLINYIVEQTGYPQNSIDFNSDLDLDLGIDSIKKVQLFGTIAETFGVFPLADASLEDFKTLNQVYDAIAKELKL